jgi:hypothetical protein
MPNDWSTTALQSAVDNELIKGSGNKILPKDNLTRAQMATILVRALGATETADISAFTDVGKDKWYYSAMATSYKMGLFKGDGAGKMNPDANITRQEAFVVLARAFNLSSSTTSGLAKFTDGGEVASWARENIEALVLNGYVGGSNGKLNPSANITRAEFAQVMYNLNKAYVDNSEELSTLGTVDGNVIVRGNSIKNIQNITVNGDLIIGDGMLDGLKFVGVKVKGRIVIRSSGNISFDGEAGEIVLATDNTKVTASENSTIKKITVNSENSSVNVSSTPTPPSVPSIPSDPITPPVDEKEEDIWTDFH